MRALAATAILEIAGNASAGRAQSSSRRRQITVDDAATARLRTLATATLDGAAALVRYLTPVVWLTAAGSAVCFLRARMLRRQGS